MQLLPFWDAGRLEVTEQTPATQAITHHKYLHGAQQNYKSIDCGDVDLKVVFQQPVFLLGHSGTGTIEEAIRINIVGHKLQMLFVHTAPEHAGAFRAGEQLGHSVWNHWHVCGIIDNIYHDITEFFDRSKCNLSVPYWTDVQRDLEGNLIVNNSDMATIHRQTLLRTKRNTDVRSAPKVDPNNVLTTIFTNVDTILPVVTPVDGDSVNGNPTWIKDFPYNGKVGYVCEDAFVYPDTVAPTPTPPVQVKPKSVTATLNGDVITNNLQY